MYFFRLIFLHLKTVLIRKEIEDDHGRVGRINAYTFGQEGETQLVDKLRGNADAWISELSLVATSYLPLER